MNKLFTYADDLHGYDDVFTFVNVFPTAEDFKEKVNQFMFGRLVEDQENWEKIYNMIFLKYKNNYFRWSVLETIYNEMASEISNLYATLEESDWLKANAAQLAGTTETIETFKTNNTSDESDPENNVRYRTDIQQNFTDNGEKEIEIRDRQRRNSNVVQEWLKGLRNMFMVHTNEVVVKSLYAKGER